MPPQAEELGSVEADIAPSETEKPLLVAASTESDEDSAEGQVAIAEKVVAMDGGEKEQRSTGNRWGSFTNNMQTRWKNRAAAAEEAKAQKAKQKETPPSLTPEQMESMRASHSSVTVVKDKIDTKLGFAIEPLPRQPNKVRIAYMASTIGLLQHAPFQHGDILEAVNGEACTNACETIQQLVHFEPGCPITLQARAPKGNPNLSQAMVRKVSSAGEASSMYELGISFCMGPTVVAPSPSPSQAPAATKEEEETATENESEASSELDEKEETSATNEESEASPASPETPSAEVPQVLQIQSIDPEGLFGKSTLSEGDWVLAINATACSQLSPEEATQLLEESEETVTVIAMKPPHRQEPTRAQRWLRQAKRAGIALGGGTMLGVGLIFIPTLPPPFGEVLIIGGVSVLGTEFEGPKRVMKSARDRLERAVGREGEETTEDKKSSETTTTEDDIESPGNENGTTEDATPEATTTALAIVASTEEADKDGAQQEQPPTKKTMGDRFKNFGRKVVLPFLDQVVGDRKDGSPATVEGHEVSPEDETTMTPASNEEATVTPSKEEEAP